MFELYVVHERDKHGNPLRSEQHPVIWDKETARYKMVNRYDPAYRTHKGDKIHYDQIGLAIVDVQRQEGLTIFELVVVPVN